MVRLIFFSFLDYPQLKWIHVKSLSSRFASHTFCLFCVTSPSFCLSGYLIVLFVSDDDVCWHLPSVYYTVSASSAFFHRTGPFNNLWFFPDSNGLKSCRSPLVCFQGSRSRCQSLMVVGVEVTMALGLSVARRWSCDNSQLFSVRYAVVMKFGFSLSPWIICWCVYSQLGATKTTITISFQKGIQNCTELYNIQKLMLAS